MSQVERSKAGRILSSMEKGQPFSFSWVSNWLGKACHIQDICFFYSVYEFKSSSHPEHTQEQLEQCLVKYLGILCPNSSQTLWPVLVGKKHSERGGSTDNSEKCT